MDKNDRRKPVLYAFSGLPGAGKSTLSLALARRIVAVYLRIDTIEQALRDLCNIEVETEGYEFAHRISGDNLRLGLDVVADSCNPVESSRLAWEKIATDSGADCLNIEILCSDRREHRRRIENRPATVPGLKVLAWDEVESRHYEPWTRNRLVIDTAGKSENESIEMLFHLLKISPPR
jgi:predicted kinase